MEVQLSREETESLNTS